MPEYTYQIEATFEKTYDGDRVDTTTVSMEHLDFFIAINHLIDEFYPAKLMEVHCVLVVDEDKEDE